MRSVVAVIAGYVFLTLAIFLLFAVWFVDAPVGDIDPSWSFILVAVLWGFLASAAAGYLCGKVAGRRPFEHGVALALTTGAIGVVSMFASFGEEPVGFQLANLVVLMSGSVAGGYLRAQRIPLQPSFGPSLSTLERTS